MLRRFDRFMGEVQHWTRYDAVAFALICAFFFGLVGIKLGWSAHP